MILELICLSRYAASICQHRCGDFTEPIADSSEQYQIRFFSCAEPKECVGQRHLRLSMDANLALVAEAMRYWPPSVYWMFLVLNQDFRPLQTWTLAPQGYEETKAKKNYVTPIDATAIVENEITGKCKHRRERCNSSAGLNGKVSLNMICIYLSY